MRLAIFGATGGTGLEVTRQALERGHSVRVLVRNPNRMPLVNENMRLVLGNVLERESVAKTILGSDAVINCLGQASLTHNMGVVSEGTRMIVEVMKKQQGVRRLVITSSFGVGESRQGRRGGSGWCFPPCCAHTTQTRKSWSPRCARLAWSGRCCVPWG